MSFLSFLTGPETVETTSSSQYKPSAQEKPIFDMLFSQLGDIMGNQQAYYPGQGYVGMSDPTQQGMQSMLGAAGGIGGMVSPFQESWQRNLNASDISNNANVQNMMQANANMANQTLNRDMLPAIQQGAIQGGGYNNARQGIAEGVAIGDTQQALANANAATQMSAYQAGLGAEANAMNQAGNLSNLYGGQANMQLGAGQIGEGYDQRALQDAMARYYFPAQEAQQRLAFGMGMMPGLKLGEQTGTSTQPNPGYTSIGSMLGSGFGALAKGGFFN